MNAAHPKWLWFHPRKHFRKGTNIFADVELEKNSFLYSKTRCQTRMKSVPYSSPKWSKSLPSIRPKQLKSPSGAAHTLTLHIKKHPRTATLLFAYRFHSLNLQSVSLNRLTASGNFCECLSCITRLSLMNKKVLLTSRNSAVKYYLPNRIKTIKKFNLRKNVSPGSLDFRPERAIRAYTNILKKKKLNITICSD